jgi:hypothetical protein
MREKRNPAPLAGGDRAGIGYAGQQSFTRDSLKRQAQQRLRRQYLITALHRLGARTTFEFVTELADLFGPYVDDRLAEYVHRLTPEMLQIAGGNRFPQGPMRVIGDGR